MEEEKPEEPEEDEEVTVGKNIIHNNFQNVDFLSNFHFLLGHSRHPVYQLREHHWPCGVKSALGVGTCADERGTNKRCLDEGDTASSEAGLTQATRKNVHSTKKLIIHLVPSNKSDLYNFLKKKKEQVRNIYGKDETYKYESHISLTGYFFCDNIFIFTKSLYLYLFYYVKLYHLSRKLSVRDLFFYIPCRVGGLACDDRRSLWGEKRYREEEQDRAHSHQQMDWKDYSKPAKCNVREKHILTTKDGYVIIPITCEWLKKIFENFQFLIKNDSFSSCRKHSQGGRDKSSRRHLRKRPAGKEEDGHFVGAKGRRYRVEEEQSGELPLRIHSQGENFTGVRSPCLKEECPTTCESGDTPLAQHNGNEPVQDSCVRPAKARCSVSSVSTSASSGDLGLCSEVTQVSDNSPPMNPTVCEKKNPPRSNTISRSSRSSWDNKIKYRYNNAKVRLLEFRVKNCNHISLASNRKNQEIQNEIAHMYRDMKYYFSNCTWDMVMFECVEEGDNTHITNGNASESSPRGNPHLNEIFRFRNFAIS
ncbi:Uncharacterized protein PCOAH_00015150 [Plasmodium coatneyi]|uniref:Uncharacterized protein n=1 Tax=Plasmodium coatneyi TaxID=208452 RepID=A0A1B1DWP9_9APIC|nr:Uncharacterized protein PCOAH_00015150 [Plasmodium coatneyi]ANQ07216.1 Uncharacterized protein PCOAH_00015150 [Plasmodium coatneyi]